MATKPHLQPIVSCEIESHGPQSVLSIILGNATFYLDDPKFDVYQRNLRNLEIKYIFDFGKFGFYQLKHADNLKGA